MLRGVLDLKLIKVSVFIKIIFCNENYFSNIYMFQKRVRKKMIIFCKLSKRTPYNRNNYLLEMTNLNMIIKS